MILSPITLAAAGTLSTDTGGNDTAMGYYSSMPQWWGVFRFSMCISLNRGGRGHLVCDCEALGVQSDLLLSLTWNSIYTGVIRVLLKHFS